MRGIRRATAEDVDAIAELVEAYWTFENVGGFDR
jgi:N-acetylglutamate synthase-like GNAT family acetyltransferase